VDVNRIVIAYHLSNQIKIICKHKILEKMLMIKKKLNKWEQHVQTGLLAGLKGRETALA